MCTSDSWGQRSHKGMGSLRGGQYAQTESDTLHVLACMHCDHIQAGGLQGTPARTGFIKLTPAGFES